MKRLLVLFATLALMVPAFACDPMGITGIVAENNLWIGVDDKADSNVTEDQFHSILDKVEKIYTPILAEMGKTLQIERKWTDGTVNAYAQQVGNTWKIFMFGGLARHQTITPDAFALVACHEMAHHIGGAPKKSSWYGGTMWASNEGQSDYYGTMKCLRIFFEGDDNTTINKKLNIDPYVTKMCSKIFHNEEEISVCERSSMAGLSLGNLFRALSGGVALSFETPDPKVVSSTDDNHPASQCRVDTYFQAALCDQDHYTPVSNTDPNVGSCARVDGYELGVRPLCWFKPSSL